MENLGQTGNRMRVAGYRDGALGRIEPRQQDTPSNAATSCALWDKRSQAKKWWLFSHSCVLASPGPNVLTGPSLEGQACKAEQRCYDMDSRGSTLQQRNDALSWCLDVRRCPQDAFHNACGHEKTPAVAECLVGV
ncbi:unnamed protein product [Natator depressus]